MVVPQVAGIGKLNLSIVLTTTLVFGVVAALLGVLLYASGAAGTFGIGAWMFVSLLFLFIQWYFGPALIKWTTHARELKPGEAIELQEMADRLARLAGIPVPKLLVVSNPSPNAFAFGRTQKSSYVAVHSGLLERLNEKEVEGVIAHEIGHIKHRDVLIMTVASALPVILYYAFILFGSSFLGGRDREGRSAGGGIAVFFGAMIAQFIGTLLVMFLSRTREGYADAFSAYATRNPRALMSALAKISYTPQMAVQKNEGVGMKALYIGEHASISAEIARAVANGNPHAVEKAMEDEKKRGWMEILMTHPPTWKRLEALHRLEKEMAA